MTKWNWHIFPDARCYLYPKRHALQNESGVGRRGIYALPELQKGKLNALSEDIGLFRVSLVKKLDYIYNTFWCLKGKFGSGTEF